MFVSTLETSEKYGAIWLVSTPVQAWIESKEIAPGIARRRSSRLFRIDRAKLEQTEEIMLSSKLLDRWDPRLTDMDFISKPSSYFGLDVIRQSLEEDLENIETFLKNTSDQEYRVTY